MAAVAVGEAGDQLGRGCGDNEGSAGGWILCRQAAVMNRAGEGTIGAQPRSTSSRYDSRANGAN
jgi:hypothetical protein